MNGVAITTSSEVVKFAQTSSGMRQNVIPGARIVMIVTRKLSAVMIDDAPAHCTPWLKKIWPDRRCVERAARSPSSRPRRHRRDDERADHHIARDRQQPERERVQARERHVRRADHQRHHVVRRCPANTGTMNRKIMQRRVDREQPVVRLRVENWMPGCASSARISIASIPPMRKKKNVVTDVLDADHLVVGVDAEVVLPAASRRARSGPPAASGLPSA